jgi:F-type H+-transporting ATPase subunit alpha
MKKVSGSLKLTYSQYRELQAFSQFGSDLDKDTKERLAKGERVVEVLKQGKNSPLPAEDQVVILYAVTNNLMRDVPVARVAEFEDALLREVNETHSELIASIHGTGKLLPETEKELKTVITEFVQTFV